MYLKYELGWHLKLFFENLIICCPVFPFLLLFVVDVFWFLFLPIRCILIGFIRFYRFFDLSMSSMFFGNIVSRWKNVFRVKLLIWAHQKLILRCPNDSKWDSASFGIRIYFLTSKTYFVLLCECRCVKKVLEVNLVIVKCLLKLDGRSLQEHLYSPERDIA